MNREQVATVLSELHKITGFRMSLHDVDFSEIAAYPESHVPLCEHIHSLPGELARCAECDREGATAALRDGKSHIYRCRYGLLEVASPLYSFGIHTGFLMMGQVMEGELAPDAAGRLCALIPDEDRRRALLAAVPRVGGDILSSYVHIMTICAEYLTLLGAVPERVPGVAALCKKYIAEHLCEKICLEDICRTLACSKSTLLSAFRKAYGCTVNAYITDTRLRTARQLLSSGEKSMSEVAALCGFGDQSYFSKVFSRRYGCSPSDYKRRSGQ